jgi:hypothetical protein
MLVCKLKLTWLIKYIQNETRINKINFFKKNIKNTVKSLKKMLKRKNLILFMLTWLTRTQT